MFEDFKTLRARREGPVLSVQLDSPDTGNAISELLLDELLAVIGAVHEEPEIRVLVLSGAGDDFCVGGDRREFERSLREDPGGTALRGMGNKARRVCDGLATLSAVTIARLHGKVIGAGLALALFCDLRVGAKNCRFRMPELALGLPTAWGGALPRLMSESGAARVRELMLTGSSFGAAKAEELAILHKVVPAERLDAAVALWTKPVVRRSAAALRATKAMLNAYASANRLADATLLDSELLASVLASHRLSELR